MDEQTGKGQQKATQGQHVTVKALDASGKVLQELHAPSGVTPNTVIWGSIEFVKKAVTG